MIGLLKKIFKKRQYENVVQAVARLNDIVPMPKREDFLGDEAKLELLDSYKSEYLKVLKQNKTITSINLLPDYLYNFKNIYADLLLHLCMKHNTDIFFKPVEENEDIEAEHFNIMITCIKLMLYQQEVVSLEEKTRLRLIALNEIVENLLTDKLFTRTKTKMWIDSVLYAINHLHTLLITFINQKMAMKIEYENYLKDISILHTYKTIDVENEDLVKKRLEEVKQMLDIIDPEELRKLDSMNLDLKLLVAIIEQKLEIYVYTHHNIVFKLRNDIDALNEKVNLKIKELGENDSLDEEARKNRNQSIRNWKLQYLKAVSKLECLYKIFFIYGINLVTPIDLEKIYDMKFKILTWNILDEEKFDILNSVSAIEFECYQNIVTKKIENILKEKNEFVNHFIGKVTASSSKNRLDIFGYIVRILKDENNEFAVEKILKDKKLLSFLLAFDKENGLTEFFQKNYVSLNDYESYIYTYHPLLQWQDNVPLSTLYRIMKCNIETEKNNSMLIKYINEHELLFYLFCLNDEYFDPSFDYHLPDGIKTILGLVPDYQEYYEYYDSINMYEINSVVRYIREKASGKNVIMPKSLEKLTGNLFGKTNILSIVLNEGLKRLEHTPLLVLSTKDIEIPSTAEDVFCSFDITKLRNITIQLKGRNLAFEKLLEEEKIESLFKLDTRYESQRFNKYFSARMHNKELVLIPYKLVPTFDNLIFIKESGEKIIFSKEALTLTIERTERVKNYPNVMNNPHYLIPNHRERKLIIDKLFKIYCKVIGRIPVIEEHSLPSSKKYYKAK